MPRVTATVSAQLIAGLLAVGAGVTVRGPGGAGSSFRVAKGIPAGSRLVGARVTGPDTYPVLELTFEAPARPGLADGAEVLVEMRAVHKT